MKKENREFLELHRDAYDEIIRAETATKANRIARDLHRILEEEFLPGYAFQEGCGSCLFNMVPLLYRRFDEWKAANPKPLIVKASFPDQKTKELLQDYIDNPPDTTLEQEVAGSILREFAGEPPKPGPRMEIGIKKHKHHRR